MMNDVMSNSGGAIGNEINVSGNTSTLLGASSVQNLEILFETPFKDKYQRNNKQSKRKNLRCFPDCNPVKHWNTGFCGQPIKVIVRRCMVPVSRVRCWAMFETTNSPEALSPGSLIPEAKIVANERSRLNPMSPWICGSTNAGIVEFDLNGFEVVKSRGQRDIELNTITVVINSERMGWHYSWVSHKHSCNCYHVLRLYVFVLQGDNKTLLCLGSQTSSPFQISCRRRHLKPASDTKPEAKEWTMSDVAHRQESTKLLISKGVSSKTNVADTVDGSLSSMASSASSFDNRGIKRKKATNEAFEENSASASGGTHTDARTLIRVLEEAVSHNIPDGTAK